MANFDTADCSMEFTLMMRALLWLKREADAIGFILADRLSGYRAKRPSGFLLVNIVAFRKDRRSFPFTLSCGSFVASRDTFLKSQWEYSWGEYSSDEKLAAASSRENRQKTTSYGEFSLVATIGLSSFGRKSRGVRWKRLFETTVKVTLVGKAHFAGHFSDGQ